MKCHRRAAWRPGVAGLSALAILLVVGPMAIVAVLLWLAKRRLVRAERAAAPTEHEPPSRTSDDLSPSA